MGLEKNLKLHIMKAFNIILFKGKKKGMIHTIDIRFDHLRAVFFPKNFREKYRYLGSIPDENSYLFKTIYPLVLAMDYEAKPKYCPRWYLRFLYLFGSDNSIVRVRNRTLHNQLIKLTKGIIMMDYKTKWEDYDLRISIRAPKHIQNLSDSIIKFFYEKGYKEKVIDKIKEIEPKFDKGNVMSLQHLVQYYNQLN